MKIYPLKPGVLRYFGLPPKILLIMKLVIIMLTICLMQVSAATFAQKLTLSKKGATLEQIFAEIHKQTGYFVVYAENKVDKNIRMDVDFKNTDLKEVLSFIGNSQELSYTLDEKNISLKPKVPSFLDRLAERWAAIDVRGVVVDSEGLPLAGATVTVKVTGKKVSTNWKGEFYLQNVEEKVVLVISYMGYESREVKAAKDIGVIKLALADSKLEEVTINAGYYKVTERERTGSISIVTAATIEKQPVNNVLQALQNRVPGLEVTQLTGVPGGGFSVRIRGQNSIRSGNDPLFIIDGVTYPSNIFTTASVILGDASPMSMLNPNDIESIEVLKDADATAIYGSRGANGVILITTKKGSTEELAINVNFSKGFSEVGNKLKLMNTEQYIAMRMEALKNGGLAPATTDFDINGTWDKNAYTDWQKEMIGGKASTTNATLGISGGNKNSNYLLSGNYYSEGTVFPGSFSFKRGGLHTSINFGSKKDRFSTNFSGTYNRLASLLPITEPTTQILRSPNAPSPYDEFGQLNWYFNNVPIGSNPMAELLRTVNSSADNLLGNVTFNYRILEKLLFKTSLGYNILKREDSKKSPNAARNPASNPTNLNRQSEFANSSNNSWTVEPQLTYDTNLGLGKFNALVGMSFQQNLSQYRNIVASNFTSDELMDNISSATVFSVNSVSYTKYKYAALFARVNYNLLDKYCMNLTARRDGSSRFGPGNQFANFGAVGASWIFSDEKFVKNHLTFLSFGKLRASYGITGNDQIPDYQYMDLYVGTSSYQGTQAIYTSGIANPNFAWETNKKAEIAIQLGFLKDRINLQVAHFRNRSSNQLLYSTLAPSVGSASVIANLPAVVQNTGWELEATIQLLTQKHWSWSTNLNLSIPKNKLMDYPGLATSNDKDKYIIGQPLGIKRYYNTIVDSQTGLYIFEDKNQNGLRDDSDKYLSKFLGQILYGGIQNSISYKQLNLAFLVSFSKQNGNSYLSSLFVPGTFANSVPTFNQSNLVLRRWQNPGDITDIPKFSSTSVGNTNFGIVREGTQGFSDASFIRIKNVSLSYSLPKKWLSKIELKDCQLTAQGQNLFTWTNYEGLDPEVSSTTALKLPPLRAFLMGIKITL